MLLHPFSEISLFRKSPVAGTHTEPCANARHLQGDEAARSDLPRKAVARHSIAVTIESWHESPGESWAEEVYKYSFSHEDEGPLGELYIDPIAR